MGEWRQNVMMAWQKIMSGKWMAYRKESMAISIGKARKAESEKQLMAANENRMAEMKQQWLSAKNMASIRRRRNDRKA